MTDPASQSAAAALFATTRWTEVMATRGTTDEARQAVSDLCAAYYAPVVAFLHREGRDEDTARDLAHDFFARLLDRPSFERATPERGRFRSYLLGALKHFLANERRHQLRDKRGGDIPHEALDSETGTLPGDTIADGPLSTPDAMFDREWALSLINRALRIMQREAEQNGTLHAFETLKPWLTGEVAGQCQAEVAGQLDLSEGALRVAIHRLRRRFRALVKSEIAQTVHDPAEVADELRHLIEALS